MKEECKYLKDLLLHRNGVEVPWLAKEKPGEWKKMLLKSNKSLYDKFSGGSFFLV